MYKGILLNKAIFGVFERITKIARIPPIPDCAIILIYGLRSAVNAASLTFGKEAARVCGERRTG